MADFISLFPSGAGAQLADDVLVTPTTIAVGGVTRVTHTMAEGATGGFFDTDVLIANPNTDPRRARAVLAVHAGSLVRGARQLWQYGHRPEVGARRRARGRAQSYQTFILLANADTSETAQVRITFLRANGTTVVRSFAVAPASRLTVRANDVAELVDESFGALIEVTSGPGIFVERALYSDSQGAVFAVGTNALATRLP